VKWNDIGRPSSGLLPGLRLVADVNPSGNLRGVRRYFGGKGHLMILAQYSNLTQPIHTHGRFASGGFKFDKIIPGGE
jgi:hypothetical protein